MKIIGVKRLKGTYNDRPYDVYRVYCLPNNQDGIIFGYTPDNIKVRADILHEAVPEAQVPSLNNREVDFYFDSYKNVAKVILK